MFLLTSSNFHNIMLVPMDNYYFLKRYFKLQEGIMFDKLEELGFGSLGYCASDNSPFWNLVNVNNTLEIEQLKIIERKFRGLNRNPTIYFENRPRLGSLVSFLLNHGYDESYCDSWMFSVGENLDMTKFGSVKKVEKENDLQIFLKTFNDSYQNGDPQNPYGELGDYLNVAEKVWFRHHGDNRLEYFIVFKKSQPVAVSTLTNFDGIGYISNVGSLRRVRGMGRQRLCIAFMNQRKTKTLCTVLQQKRATIQTSFISELDLKLNL